MSDSVDNELDRIVEWAEDLCGVGHKAWDTIDPRLIASAILEAADNLQLTQKQEQGEPVAYLNPDDVCADTAFRWCKIDEFTQPVYTTPQPAQKPWVGLTDEQYFEIGQRHWLSSNKVAQIHRELDEAAHGIKENT